MRFTQDLRFAHSIKRLFMLCGIFIIMFAGVGMAEFWDTKLYDEWNQKEVDKMLSDSPWAKELNLQSAAGSFSSSAMDNQPPYVKYTVQLRSVPLVRQGVIRRAQLTVKYDAFSETEKIAFDQRMEPILFGYDPEYVVVHVSFDTNQRDYLRDLLRHWETQSTEMLQNSVFLRGGSRGKQIPILQYIPGEMNSQEFQFIFPREVDGSEVLKADDKVLRLEFSYPQIGRLGDGRGFLEFRTDRMKVNDETVY